MSGLGPKTNSTYNVAAPSHYVAGAGRGAIGFTTRSDIGPAGPAVGAEPGAPPALYQAFQQPQFGQAPAGYVAGVGRAMGELARDQGDMAGKPIQHDADRGDYSESNYDEFSGYGEKLFVSTPYDEDDVEADQIYGKVDDLMESRRKRRREAQMLHNAQKRNERPKISEQFADLKQQLSTVSSEQWDAIPEVGDHSLKFKQKKKDTFTPVPDFLLESASKAGGVFGNSAYGGLETPGTQSTVTGLAEARGASLTLKLDKISDSVTGQTVVDPKGYLTDLNSLKVSSDADVGDFKKARALLSSVTSTNPKHGPGWIAAARVEEVAGKMVQARKVIYQGCEECPEAEDVWIEAARLHTVENAKSILANAVRHLPTSVKIWLVAADLEGDNTLQKKVVLRRALEFVPNSVTLWKTAIGLEDEADARIMLARAVECVPGAIDMWLQLAKLETHENARKVLNQAREANPTEAAPWITAAKLEEANNKTHMVSRIVEKMMTSLAQYQVEVRREHWLREAEEAESSGAPITCAALVKYSANVGVDEEDRLTTWMSDAEACVAQSSVITARALYAHALSIFPHKKALWLAAAWLEKDHGTADSLESILKEGVKNCPHEKNLWLFAAKEKWMAQDVPSARAILIEAFEANPQSEEIWLAAIKLEWENKLHVRARALLAKARAAMPSERIWMKSAILEREMGEISNGLSLLDQAIKVHPRFAKYYMMAGQACQDDLKDFSRARDYYEAGLSVCPESVPLWLLVVRLEEQAPGRGANKARSVLEKARLRLPRNEVILLAAVRLERRAGNDKIAETLMATALQECATSGLLWAEEVLTCTKHQQKAKSIDALKKCDNDPNVIVAVARRFAKDNKAEKARKWFDRAVALCPQLGDSWAHYYAFELKQFSSPTVAALEAAMEDRAKNALVKTVMTRCMAAEPNRGELWCAVAKSTEMRKILPEETRREKVLQKVVEGILEAN